MKFVNYGLIRHNERERSHLSSKSVIPYLEAMVKIMSFTVDNAN